MKALTLSYALCALALTSCQVMSPSSEMNRATGVPDSWSATKQAQSGIDTEWVRRFKDPTLERLVAESIGSNLELKALNERVTQARQQARITRASVMPQVGATFLGARQKSSFLGMPRSGSNSAYNSYGVSMDLSWELDLWGRVRSAQKAEIAQYEAQHWNFRAAVASLKAEVVRSYFAIAEANEQIHYAAEAVKINEQTRDAISERFVSALSDEGGTAAQYRIVESDYENAKADLVRWQSETDRIKRQLEILLGRYPSGSIVSLAKLPKPPSSPPSGLPSELLLRRPDILEAERMLASAKQRKKEATRAFFPRFSLTGSSGTSTSELRNVLNSGFGVWSIGGNLTQAILTGGTLQAERKQRKSKQTEQINNLQNTVLTAFGEVETALAQEAFLAKRLAATQKAVTLARDAVDASSRDYQSGASDILTALAAQSRLIATNSALTSLKRLQLDNRINLHLALGGDYKTTSK